MVSGAVILVGFSRNFEGILTKWLVQPPSSDFWKEPLLKYQLYVKCGYIGYNWEQRAQKVLSLEQTDATLSEATCCVRLHTLLHFVACCWELLHPIEHHCNKDTTTRKTVGATMLWVVASLHKLLKNAWQELDFNVTSKIENCNCLDKLWCKDFQRFTSISSMACLQCIWWCRRQLLVSGILIQRFFKWIFEN